VFYLSGGEYPEVASSVDSEVSVSALQQLDVMVAQQLARPRFLATLFSGLGCFAGLLGIVGLYAVIAATVKQREHEIAVRMAVGADGRKIPGLFMNEGSRLVLAGLLLGTLGAFAMGRLLEAQLFGVSRIDFPTLGLAALALGASAAGAIWWPARRASRTDPVLARKGGLTASLSGFKSSRSRILHPNEKPCHDYQHTTSVTSRPAELRIALFIGNKEQGWLRQS
jgi:ABC-type antimicrobial peptide transport system permease subunit